MSNKLSDPAFWKNREQRKNNRAADAAARTKHMGAKYGNPTKQTLDTDSSRDEKRVTSEAVYEFLADALFDKVSFISFPFTQTKQIYYMETDNIAAIYTPSQWIDVPASGEDAKQELADDGISTISEHYINPVEGPVTDTDRYWGISRIPNTSEGKFLSPDKRNRMRCSFYVDNYTQLNGYILSPVVYDSFKSLNYFTSMSIFRSYVGLKFDAGVAYVAVKQAGQEEELIQIDLDISFDTHRLDMVSTGKETTIRINNTPVGTYPVDLIGDSTDVDTFLPLLSRAKSIDGTEVGITIENFQFIQNN